MGEKNKYRERVRWLEGKKQGDADQDKGMEKLKSNGLQDRVQGRKNRIGCQPGPTSPAGVGVWLSHHHGSPGADPGVQGTQEYQQPEICVCVQGAGDSLDSLRAIQPLPSAQDPQGSCWGSSCCPLGPQIAPEPSLVPTWDRWLVLRDVCVDGSTCAGVSGVACARAGMHQVVLTVGVQEAYACWWIL